MVRLPRASALPILLLATLTLTLPLTLSGCGLENPNATRNQGEDCDGCHKPGGKAPRTLFTASGSVFRSRDGEPLESGAREIALTLTDRAGKALELKTNAGGNFFTSKELAYPVKVALRTLPDGAMREGPEGVCTHGNCNLCHHVKTPTGGARGRLVKP